MVRLIIVIALFGFSLLANAAPSWYLGEINRVWPNSDGGGFIITYTPNSSGNSSLTDCRHQYAYFRESHLPTDKMKNSFSLAISAFHSGSTVGVVIDKELDGDYCFATSLDIRK